MNQKEFTRRVASVLRENDARKRIPSTKHVFHISDDMGNSKDFIIKKDSRGALFNIEDVDTVIKACIEVVLDSISNGESISILRLGTLGLQFVKGRTIRNVHDGSMKVIPSRYIPRLSFGKELKMRVKMYQLNLEERAKDEELVMKNYGDYDITDDGEYDITDDGEVVDD